MPNIIDEEFWSTCENISEVAEEMEELRELYGKPKAVASKEEEND